MSIADVAGPDAPTTTNDLGAKQSHIPARFDLVDGAAMFEMCKVLHEGAEKYGEDNWRGIGVREHINHLIMHGYAWLQGDQSDEHLSHMMCRSMFAQGVACQGGPRAVRGVTAYVNGKAFILARDEDVVADQDDPPCNATYTPPGFEVDAVPCALGINHLGGHIFQIELPR